MQPFDRNSLIQYCLRELGNGIVQINVTPDQMDDRVDQAIDFFTQFHTEGVMKVYTGLQVTANAQNNKFFQMSSNVVGVNKIFILSTQTIQSASTQSFNMFDLNYQIRLNELYDFTSADYVYFELANEHIRTLEMLFIGNVPIRYNRYDNRLFLDMDWFGDVIAGSWIIAETWNIVDNNAFYSDIWLKQFTTALIKRQWGNNLKKWTGVPLPGGIAIDGNKIFEEADEEVKRLAQELRDIYEAPVEWMVG